MKTLVVASAICLLSSIAALAWTHGAGTTFLTDNSNVILTGNGTDDLLAQ